MTDVEIKEYLKDLTNMPIEEIEDSVEEINNVAKEALKLINKLEDKLYDINITKGSENVYERVLPRVLFKAKCADKRIKNLILDHWYDVYDVLNVDGEAVYNILNPSINSYEVYSSTFFAPVPYVQISDLLEKVNDAQFVLHALEGYTYTNKEFSITDSSQKDAKVKAIAIDFGQGDFRYVTVDRLLLILQEFYGKEFLVTLAKKLKPYSSIKDVVLPLKPI